ncbi:E3 ubiquitin-protein ligase SHPRH-like [Papaver somniferum]|uniref:E3 ubiquitin-protein ligase SHPRH-like n=1 Tax=Papaver somniferum TaxID=3469 RepID=UPI000E6F9862|nr:E3 ubiquitin-protein ligase SHPRH-like [Papaver somniferum]
MGRKKARPHRSGGGKISSSSLTTANGTTGSLNSDKTLDADSNKNIEPQVKPFLLVDIDQTLCSTHEHLDIAEIVLKDFNYKSRDERLFDFEKDKEFSLRFRLCNLQEEFANRFRFGHVAVMPAHDIFLELLVDKEMGEGDKVVVFEGNFDGSDEGISSLVQLISQKMLAVRPVKEVRVSEEEEFVSITLRVEILKTAFDLCGSLLETSRKPWKKSMMSVMSWLRPEVTTCGDIYTGIEETENMEIDACMDETVEGSSGCDPRDSTTGFDVAEFYDSVKPSKGEPMLDDELPDLRPTLRPYQRRAANWMVQREKGASEILNYQNQFFRPLSVTVCFLDTESKMFYNPYSGNISLHPESSSSYVSGGILADEMGLGKTVELLACIFAHRRPTSDGDITFNNQMQVNRHQISNLKRLKRERVECICGAVNESHKYKGLWVQCDICDAWQHADCVGYSTVSSPSDSHEAAEGTGHQQVPSVKNNESSSTKIVEDDGNFTCQLCLELIQASSSPVNTGATLVVCPASILQQWNAEIIRHIEPGSLKICIYEGVRNASLSATSTMDICELINADIVLTTYDVLKGDLSHDGDRHEGDRRLMRFKKRYPVVPTLLTRIFWWRICLDEAQMVESNVGYATEMALRLHARYHWCITGTPIQRRLDDLYVLLRFLKATPYDTHKWWIKVIRDPYERKDTGAIQLAHKFFKQIMWRSSKADVSDELQLPPQKDSVAWLTFSAIEAHFYQRQHETCVNYARELIRSFKDNARQSEIHDSESIERSADHLLTHYEAAKLLQSLLKLRQACCHPQVGSSGLRSIQHSPMTMQEILDVLVGKTKTEGEEALRKLIVSLNGLAGIAVLEQDPSRAVSMYREALALAEEYSDDFRLDPLLNLHIHHNLAEILPVTSGYSQEHCSMGGQLSDNAEKRDSKLYGVSEFGQHPMKRQKISEDNSSSYLTSQNSQQEESHVASELEHTGAQGNKGTDNDVQQQMSSRSFAEGCLRECENTKLKYLSMFNSKLSSAQQEFRNAHMQVSNAFGEQQKQPTNWWLEALQLVEQKESSSNELIRRICDAISGTLNSSKSPGIASRFQSTSGLKYVIQTCLDSLEASRQDLLGRVLEIDLTMEKPRDEDIARVRYCRNCQDNKDGPLCVLCELDELFQAYEARLFRLTKGGDGGMIASAEEAVDLQKKKSELNRFYWGLSRPKDGSSSSLDGNKEDKKQRDVRAKVVVSRSPSELEIVLGVIKSYTKSLIGKEALSVANKHLRLLEGMRKEFTQARFLATAQSQVLRAHDEIKMATSRLRLREDENDTSLDALSSAELVAANVEFSNEKFVSLSLLSTIKGQLRYLKGLILSKQKVQLDRPNSPTNVDTDNSSAASPYTREQNGFINKAEDEACPVCQDKLQHERMVFQCGHVTCCRCLVAMSERSKSRNKWIMCPTCRKPTDLGNIALADDSQSKACNSGLSSVSQGHEMVEASISVQGSYGTKIEAVTKRILWIKSTDPKAKVLVFSSWNDVLDVLEHAFSANNISHIRMKGGRKSHVALSKFKGEREPEEKSIQVLLLLFQHGANGLNLLEAQHVILIEPLLNPATEAQAINRVHRIGQDKTTLVHRFIVKDTVEESIYKLNRGRSTSSVISGKTKNQDQSVLTLKDVESLFSSATPSMQLEDKNVETGSLKHLPPAVAAALAAERRLKESLTRSM